MSAPSGKQSGGSRQRKQQSSAASKQGPTEEERKRQSRRDKAHHQAVLAALALQSSNPKGRGKSSAQARGKQRNSGKLTPVGRFLASLRKGMPSPVPTRLEILHFRVRYSLTAGQKHMILFHPANSVALGIATGYFDEPRNLLRMIDREALMRIWALADWETGLLQRLSPTQFLRRSVCPTLLSALLGGSPEVS